METESRISANQAQRERFANTIKLVEQVLADGAHEKVPQRNLDISLTYLLSPPDISLEKTGEIFDRTKETVRKIRDRTIPALLENSLPSTQAKFSLEDLELNKPQEIKPLRVKEAKERPVLQSKTLAEDLKNAKTDEEKQRLLNSVTRGLYHRLTKGDNPILIAVKSLVSKGGFHLPNRKDFTIFQQAIKSADIPMGNLQYAYIIDGKEKKFSYHFICSSDTERAIEALNSNQNLKPFLRHPVRQIIGPQEKELPSTAALIDSGTFRGPGTILSKLGIANRQQREFIDWLIEQNDCPTAIYTHDKKLFYPLIEEKELKHYFTKKREEMVLAAA